jgi:signal transduction histidine kinase/ligand-binding sensor protein
MVYKKDKWPFVPLSLSDIIDKESLAVIESGCCERLGRPLTILDFYHQKDVFWDRIESINEKQRYVGFCRLLRSEECVKELDKICQKSDIEQARRTLEEFFQTGELFRSFQCHMGLIDMTHMILIGDYPVALVFTGQFSPNGGIELVKKNIEALCTKSGTHNPVDENTLSELLRLTEKLSPPSTDFIDRFKKEVHHIQSIAETEYHHQKYNWEQEFLGSLRILSHFNPAINLEQLRTNTKALLHQIMNFCRCDYAVLFASTQENSTVLPPIADVGLPDNVNNFLPHFNWKKAKLPLESFNINLWSIFEGLSIVREYGIRGDNSEFFGKVGCILPVSIGNKYRCVLVLGPFAESVNLVNEEHFLKNIANIISIFTLNEIAYLNLEQERNRWKNTAALIIHQNGSSLAPIAAQIGRAKLLTKRMNSNNITKQIIELLNRAEEKVLDLDQGARKTLDGHIFLMEKEDLDLVRYPLSVLVQNCVEGFISEAEGRHRKIIIEKNVESLPDAVVDVARLKIALSNLIHNAIKYSFPNTTIFIRSRYSSIIETESPVAVIDVDNLGEKIPNEDLKRIFDKDTRGLTAVKMGYIPGSGLGLWEARAIMDAHDGEIHVSCQQIFVQRIQRIAHRIIFSLTLPLRDKYLKE